MTKPAQGTQDMLFSYPTRLTPSRLSSHTEGEAVPSSPAFGSFGWLFQGLDVGQVKANITVMQEIKSRSG